MEIREMASVYSGIYVSSLIKEGDVFYLQARDFNSDREIVANLAPSIAMHKNLEKHFLRAGDILLVAKGNTFFSAVFKDSHSPAVASSVFLVIRLFNFNIIHPNYLSWYLNLPKTQTMLHAMAKGTGISSISKKGLLELEIPVPTLEKQVLVLELAQIKKKESDIFNQIIALKELQFNHLITKSINENKWQ